MSQHSQDEKKREAEEEKRRLEDQKKVDVEKLVKLKKAYQAAQEEYIVAKEKFEEKYGNETTTSTRFPFYIEDWDRLINELNNHYWGR